jgi:hypothetical protein
MILNYNILSYDNIIVCTFDSIVETLWGLDSTAPPSNLGLVVRIDARELAGRV